MESPCFILPRQLLYMSGLTTNLGTLQMLWQLEVVKIRCSFVRTFVRSYWWKIDTVDVTSGYRNDATRITV
jgi:hypothetical protein